MFPAVGGAHQATYGGGRGHNLSPPRRSRRPTRVSTDGDVATEEPGTSTSARHLARKPRPPGCRSPGRTTDHLAELEGLAPATRYYYRLESRGPGGALTTWPAAHAAPASFTTTGADRRAPRISDLRVVPMPDGTARVTWRTDEPATSLVRFGPAGRSRRGVGLDDRLVRRHVVVVTHLAAHACLHGAGGISRCRRDAARGRTARFRSLARGLAMFTLEDFRTGTTDGLVGIDERGLGSLTLQDRGSGSYTSRVIDSGRKATWRRLVLDADQPAGARVLVGVRPVTGRPPGRDVVRLGARHGVVTTRPRWSLRAVRRAPLLDVPCTA